MQWERKHVKKKKTKKKTVKVDIPKGVQNNRTINVEGEGHTLPGKLPGDVEVTVKIKHHYMYTRMGADLCCEKAVTVKDALCGFTCQFEHVSGAKLKYECKGGVKHNQIKRFKGWGLPQLGGHLGMVGNLLVQFTVVFPLPSTISDSLSDQLKAILTKLEYVKTEPKQKEQFGVGARVLLVNLQNFPELNGKLGIIIAPTERGFAVKLDESGKLISVPLSKLKLADDKKRKKRRNSKASKAKKKFQEENDYEEEVTGSWVKSDNDIKVTPAVASGSAYDQEDERHSSRMKGEACQHQ